ncbi:MAG: hypothetical protein AAF487_09020, partial [Bacteroidota bacterium]
MEELLNEITQVLAKTKSIPEFEDWLYGNSFVLNNIETNENYLALASINYRERRAIEDLERLFFKMFSNEEYICKIL